MNKPTPELPEADPEFTRARGWRVRCVHGTDGKAAWALQALVKDRGRQRWVGLCETAQYQDEEPAFRVAGDLMREAAAILERG